MSDVNEIRSDNKWHKKTDPKSFTDMAIQAFHDLDDEHEEWMDDVVHGKALKQIVDGVYGIGSIYTGRKPE